MNEFTGWPADAPALLASIAADNTREHWAAIRESHARSVLAPMRALAAALAADFGPVRVFRPQVNRRFRPDAAPYRTDTGGVARSPGGAALGVVLTAASLSITAGQWSFDGPQLRRFRAAVAGRPGEELAGALAALGDLAVHPGRTLTGTPRGYPADHPRIGLLRHRGLQVGRCWELGPWLSTAEPHPRVRAGWSSAAPVLGWLDAHVGPADPVPVRPRPSVPAAGAEPPVVVGEGG